MNKRPLRRGTLAAALTSLTLIAGCSFGLWTLYPSADVQLPWAADLDDTESYFLVSDLYASQVKVLSKQGSLLASVPFSTLPDGTYIDEITRNSGEDYDWFGLGGNGRLFRFIYDPSGNTLLAVPLNQGWLGNTNVWATCDIASGDWGDLFVSFIELTNTGARTVVRRLNPNKSTVEIVVQPNPTGTCGHLDHDAILRQIVYYDPTSATFVRAKDDLSALAGTTNLPPNSNSAVHDFVAEAGYLIIGHVKVLNGTRRNYVTMQNAAGSVQDSMLFQSVFELVLEGPTNNDAWLFVFGQQSNAMMHRYELD